MSEKLPSGDRSQISRPELWQTILADLRRKLFFPTHPDADAFFSAIHPMGFKFRDLTSGAEQWEIEVQPDYLEHLMTLLMHGMKYQRNRLDG